MRALTLLAFLLAPGAAGAASRSFSVSSFERMRVDGPFRVEIRTGASPGATVEADRLQATVIGSGTMTLAGRAGRARLLTNGPGTIDAGALVADDLTVRLDGTGDTRASARYSAKVTDTGLGRVLLPVPPNAPSPRPPVSQWCAGRCDRA